MRIRSGSGHGSGPVPELGTGPEVGERHAASPSAVIASSTDGHG